jgi:hypothetical protein
LRRQALAPSGATLAGVGGLTARRGQANGLSQALLDELAS